MNTKSGGERSATGNARNLEAALAELVRALVGTAPGVVPPVVDAGRWLEGVGPGDGTGAADATRTAAAFLVTLVGPDHPLAQRALAVLDGEDRDGNPGLASLLRGGLADIRAELHARASEPAVRERLLDGAAGVIAATDPATRTEAVWRALFPEGAGLRGHEAATIDDIRARRTITIHEPPPAPITDPARELLFTSNVLLTVPLGTADPDRLPADEDLRAGVEAAAREPQQHWYDHPIPIGVAPDASELLHGLRGLDDALAFEQAHGRLPARVRVPCLLSVSVTHAGLQAAARGYVEGELRRAGGLRHLDVIVVTEADTRRLRDEVLVPGARRYLPDDEAADDALDVVGVDGEYGRHYTFLKAAVALWHVLVDERVRATFKIDLDQVFPQDVLVAETGASAFEHLASPLWGGRATDPDGQPLELGMLAGALVNQRDIGRGLFTADVDASARPLAPDEHVFFSVLPQALSTRAEMLARYEPGTALDGRHLALQRVHVTGGTNGILVDALRRHRPFTPSFVGRAEDQAYLLSVLGLDGGPRLAYAHAAGLIMRHDKEAYAREAIEAAAAGKLLGDDVRILVFSAYARTLAAEGLPVGTLKALLDPFTGAFVSALPVTVVLLRYALRILGAAERGDERRATELAEGAPRLREAMAFTGEPGRFEAAIARERRGWDRYYDALDVLEAALRRNDLEALALRDRARAVVDACRVHANRT